MQGLIVKLLESKFKIKVYEIKYVNLEEQVSVVNKINGYKGFADFALKTLKTISSESSNTKEQNES